MMSLLLNQTLFGDCQDTTGATKTVNTNKIVFFVVVISVLSKELETSDEAVKPCLQIKRKQEHLTVNSISVVILVIVTPNQRTSNK